MLSLLFIGLLIGMRHALEADHVAAVASLATSTSSLKSAIKHGAVWGLGHTITLSLFGSIVILTDSVMPENLALGLEFAVGIMLVVLGVDVIRRMLRDRIHFHTHQHNNQQQHFHAHKHANEKTHNPKKHEHKHAKQFPVKALFIGIMHGMAGSAALILLTLQTVSSPWTGMLYMLLFGIGSIVGMAILSVIIAIPLKHSATGLTWLNNGLQGVIGFATIIIGVALIYDIGGNFI
ncbi:MAG: sulfite exporter TauE/SafE family protein [Gammaproteobacteria bacterium]|nr:sulfite exporter TauE/SafE family protein [Gammaproteobacteria bacterium]